MPEQVGNDNSKSLSAIGYYWLICQTLSYSVLCSVVKNILVTLVCALSPAVPGATGNASVPKIIVNDTIVFFLCNQHFGNLKP